MFKMKRMNAGKHLINYILKHANQNHKILSDKNRTSEKVKHNKK